ncbi:recombinase family protein [Paenibacillus sp. NPDC058177]|uniref:recombinase family protein n=1 Tax=Paenibacillus sp. NPDC058177 TaxID=3346369 RepID=UPI0036D77634
MDGHVLRLVFILLNFLTVLRRMMHFGERYVYLGLGLNSLAQYFDHMLMKLPQRFAGWLINFFDYIFTFLHELSLQNFTVVIFDDVSSKMLNILFGWRQKFNTFGVETIMESKTIKHVAVYLRKSRDDGEFEDVLSKHRDTLLTLVENRNWTYRLYEEVASGEKIESRKEMQKLLRHVEDKLYDGVVVMDIDRLGRGENKD